MALAPAPSDDDEEQETGLIPAAPSVACSILHPAPARRPAHQSNNRLPSNASTAAVASCRSGLPEFPSLFDEPPAAAVQRSIAFHNVWSAMQERVQDAVQELNWSTFGEVKKWIAKEKHDRRIEGLQASSGGSDSSQERPQQRVTGDDLGAVLPTALLFAGGLEWTDHRRTFGDLATYLRQKQYQVACLSPRDFVGGSTGSGSSVVKSLLCQFTGGTPETTDLEVLAAWHAEGGGRTGSPLLVLLEDAEGCPPAGLAHLLLLLCEWRLQLPLALLLGVGTSAGALRRVLPAPALARLRTQRFSLPPAAQRMDAALRAALLTPACALTPSPECARTLLALTQQHDATLASLLRCLKVALLDHFATQPLSPLSAVLPPSQDPPDQGRMQERCAELSPWLLSQALGRLGPARSVQQLLLEGAGQVAQALQTLGEKRLHWCTALLCLHAAAEVGGVAPRGGLAGTLAAASLAPREGSALEGMQPLLAACASALRAMLEGEVAALLEVWEQLSSHAPAVRERVEGLRRSIAADGQGGDPAGKGEEEPSGGGWERAEAARKGVSRGTSAVRAQMGLSADLRRRAMLSQAGPTLQRLPILKDGLLELLHSLARDAAQAWEGGGLEDALLLELRPPLQQVLVASQRAALAGDLLMPARALNCTCCQSGIRGGGSLPDTCLAYALCLQQPLEGASIPAWYCAFAAAQPPSHDGRASKAGRKRGRAEPPGGYSSAVVQGRFVLAAAELQLLGVVQAAKRRPQHMHYLALQ